MKNIFKIGAFAAFYNALAYLAAIPYFLLIVNYPAVTDPLDKLTLITENFSSMWAMHVIVYEFVALGIILLALALYRHLKTSTPVLAQAATVVAFIWAALLLGSSMVFNYGMLTAVNLASSEPGLAVWAWQVMEAVAQGLGGAGGELLGSAWLLLLNLAGFRAGALPKGLNWLGLVVAAAGLLSNIPALNQAAVIFGLLQIVWFILAGFSLLKINRKGEQAAA